jgi:hypothetical protein
MSTKKSGIGSRLPRFEGADGDYQYYSTPSDSREDLRHDLYICKRTGVMMCQCEDALYRKKQPDMMEVLSGDTSNCCKHVRAWVVAYKHKLENQT